MTTAQERAELRELAEAAWVTVTVDPSTLKELLDDIDRLEAERDSYKADAEQYRWLRDDGTGPDYSLVVAKLIGSANMRRNDPLRLVKAYECAELDVAVRAAMKGDQP